MPPLRAEHRTARVRNQGHAHTMLPATLRLSRLFSVGAARVRRLHWLLSLASVSGTLEPAVIKIYNNINNLYPYPVRMRAPRSTRPRIRYAVRARAGVHCGAAACASGMRAWVRNETLSYASR